MRWPSPCSLEERKGVGSDHRMDVILISFGGAQESHIGELVKIVDVKRSNPLKHIHDLPFRKRCR